MISYILSIASLIHMWLMGNRWKWAPLCGVLLQFGWFYYAFAERQEGFVIGAIGFTIVHLRNHIKWVHKNELETTDEEKQA